MTALLALIGALVVGASDFGGGIAARQVSPLRVAAWIQAASLGLIITVVWFVDAPEVRGVDIGAGVSSVAGAITIAWNASGILTLDVTDTFT